MFIFRFIGPLLLLVLLYWLVQKFSKRHGLTTSQFKWLLGIAALLGVGIVLVMLGRIPIQTLAAPFLLALTFALRNIGLLIRLFPMLQMLQRRHGSRAGRAADVSTIRTRFLAMELQHATGEMDGEVLEGQFKGHRVSALTVNELLQLAGECRRDADSIQVLEAYMDRCHPDWREQEHGGQGGANGHHKQIGGEADMNESLALEILGLAPGASEEEIVSAHRKLMQKMHPDRGGSDYLARRINAARDFLLK